MTLLMHDKNLMLAQVSISKGCFIIQTEYAKCWYRSGLHETADQCAHRDGLYAGVRPALRPMARAVARHLLAPYGKESELDAYFGI